MMDTIDRQGATASGAVLDAGRPAVALSNVTRIFGSGDTRVVALDDVSCRLPGRSWTAVMGPSGSGKSTLLHIAGGLEPVTSGSVEIDGEEITGLDDNRLTELRRDRIGFIFQDFNLVGSLTAEQNVALPGKLAGRRPTARATQAALERVGLGDRIAHKPRELSGGQQQRVAIARSLAMDPAVLLADEPTGALDSNSSRIILDLLRAMVDTEGQTIVMVTHDPVAAARADRVVFLSDGRITYSLDRPTAADVADHLTRLEG